VLRSPTLVSIVELGVREPLEVKDSFSIPEVGSRGLCPNHSEEASDDISFSKEPQSVKVDRSSFVQFLTIHRIIMDRTDYFSYTALLRMSNSNNSKISKIKIKKGFSWCPFLALMLKKCTKYTYSADNPTL